MTRRIVYLAGGVGGSKLAVGLASLLSPDELTIVVNTGDDEEFHGLHVSPDVDTVMYALAGLTNEVSGWGVTGDTFSGLSMLERLGAPTWFNLGDKDLATHIRRTQLLRQGWSLSKVTNELSQQLGIKHRIVPMSDDSVRTVIHTPEGPLAFQDYFVRRRCEPSATAIDFAGVETAHPSPGFSEALQEATTVIYGPSNPIVSIGPVLALPGLRERLQDFSGPRIAVSPIVGGEAVRGPAAKMLRELGEKPGVGAIARRLAGLCDILVIDETDRDAVSEVERWGMKAVAEQTIMTNLEDRISLAGRVLELAS
jgi:LPPG:FO 2-phospho-L-lactate transferase